MRLIHTALTCLMLVIAPLASVAAGGGGASVRAISFVASNEPGASDARLAPYEPVLRSNLRFQSYRYVGESAASVSAGGTATISLPDGNRVDLEADKSGGVKVHRGGTVVSVSPGHPAVLMGGRAGKGEVAGIIVLAN
jgi:hypothetical protein